jgi:feruloyl esterase
VEAARKIYQGPRHARTGAELYSPLYPGSELGWGQLAGGDQPLGIPVEFFKFYVLRDPAWDYRTRPINYDSDVAASDRPEIPAGERGRSGSAPLLHAWREAPARGRLERRGRAAKGGDQLLQPRRGRGGGAANARLHAVLHGAGHGPRAGTAGAENFDFDALSLIEQWKEHGVAPDQLTVGHYKDGKRVGARLVCQYPRVAFYKGGGLDTEDPASFDCRAK